MTESEARPGGRHAGPRGRGRNRSDDRPRGNDRNSRRYSEPDDGPGTERQPHIDQRAAAGRAADRVSPTSACPTRIDDGLAACGFAQPFAIQTEAVPVAMQGRDVCGRAKTGSGKTLAFGVPMLARITDKAEPRKPLGLVLVPTRELAVQVAEVLEPIASHAGMRVLAVYGGASRHTQIEELAKGVELVVATPLRLIDLIKSTRSTLDDVQIVCLDEADRMADDGFTPQVEWILRHCTGRNQTMLFSATLDGDVGHLIRHYLTDPIEVAIDEADRHGRHDAPPLPGRAPHGQGQGDRVRSGKGIPKVLVFCQTKRTVRPRRAQPAGSRRRGRRRFTAICSRRLASAPSSGSPKASWRCSSPPMSQLAVSTSTTSAR